MKISEMIGKAFGRKEEPEQELRDDQTRDKYLRSLRREYRVFQEEEEKKWLIAKIAELKKQKVREGVFGIKLPEHELNRRPENKSLLSTDSCHFKRTQI